MWSPEYSSGGISKHRTKNSPWASQIMAPKHKSLRGGKGKKVEDEGLRAIEGKRT